MRWARLALPMAIAAALAAGGAAPASAACSYTAKLRAPTHHPRATHRWPITVTVSRSLRTSAHYEFFYNGQRVATRYVRYNKRFAFRRRFRDPTITWPKRAIGIPLSFHVVLHNACGTKHLRYAVKVRK